MKNNRIIFILILLIGIILRINKLYNIPYGIHIDELGMYEDAVMIENNQTDRYNHKYPVYLQNYGGGQSAMYSYITSFLIALFSNSYLLIRIPSIISGIILIIYSYLIGKELLDKKKALLLMLLTSICPYFIQASRIGLDCNLLLPFFTISTYYLIKAIKQNNNKKYILSGILFGTTLYTYALSYLIIPLFLLLTIIYLLQNKKITKNNIICLVVPIIILGLPLILFLLVNYNILPEFRFINSDMYTLSNFRTNEISIRNIIDNFDIFMQLLTSDGYSWNSNILFGTLTYTLVPILIYGMIKFTMNLYKNYKQKKYDLQNIIFFMLISTYIIMLIIENPNINKANSIYFSFVYITTYGLIHIKEKFRNIVVLIFIINSILFYNYYINDKIIDKNYFDLNINININEKYIYKKH